MLTQKRLKELLHYDPETGIFTRNIARSGGYKAGDIAGHLRKGGYRSIGIDSRSYYASRLAWLYMRGEWPINHIDHIDGDPLNNRISNLRDVNMYVNSQNQRHAQAGNRSGYLGVYFRSGKKYKNAWGASIVANGKTIYLGVFLTPERAHDAYLTAKRKFHEGCTI